MAFRDLESKAAALRFQQDALDYIAHRFVSFIALINSFPVFYLYFDTVHSVTHHSVGSCETPLAFTRLAEHCISYKRSNIHISAMTLGWLPQQK